jgi:hypothetical protein
MATQVDYLPIAAQAGANVDPQVNFEGSGYQQTGFQAGLAESKQLNKCWRQASVVAAMIANFIANQLNVNVLDDGNVAGLLTLFVEALLNAVSGSLTPTVTVVPFSANPVFNCPGSLVVNFEITLTGNVASSTLTSELAGQIINFIIHQDATGSRTFAYPAGVPGGNINPVANSTTVQSFLVDSTGAVHAITPSTD